MRRITSILAILLVACNGGGGSNCTAGSEGCECRPGGLCDPTSTCVAGICVPPAADTSTDTQVDTLVDTATDDFVGEVECNSDSDCDDGDPCTDDNCDLDYNECLHGVVDRDGDGYSAEDVDGTTCPGGTDCDDGDDSRYPDAPLDCTGGEDADCDGAPDDDEDGDGFTAEACPGGSDCDDSDPSVQPSCDLRNCGPDPMCGVSCGICTTPLMCSGVGICEHPGWSIVSAGVFTMGSPEAEPGRYEDEDEHEVTLTHDFEMLQNEVSQAQFEAVMGYQTACNISCGDTCPVECVSWSEAAAYCSALSLVDGLAPCYECSGVGPTVICTPSTDFVTPYDCPGYRLPTEAEWEYAARAGTTGGTYRGTSVLTQCEIPNTVLDPIAWYCANAGSVIHEAGDKIPNGWDLFDVLGNVWEWCGDWYGAYEGTITDPWGPSTGTYHVFRGGAWGYFAWACRAANRGYGVDDDSTTNVYIGFRPVRTLP